MSEKPGSALPLWPTAFPSYCSRAAGCCTRTRSGFWTELLLADTAEWLSAWCAPRRHATSRDLVTWTNHGNQIGTYSGFVLPDESGKVCAGQRCNNIWCGADGTRVTPSCGDPRQTGCPGLFINGTGAMNGTSPDMVPMFLTCATDSTLSKWEGHREAHPSASGLAAAASVCTSRCGVSLTVTRSAAVSLHCVIHGLFSVDYPFNPREYRAMAFDPQAWKDDDGMYYIAVATDACNETTRQLPCVDGQSMYLWRAPRLMAPAEVSYE